MATAEQYANWIVQNADKKGTPEFETVAQAYKIARGGAGAAKDMTPAQPAGLAPEDTPSFGQTALIGAGRTFDRIGKGMQQLYYGATGNDKELAALQERAGSDDAAYAPLREARPWATGIGESLPSMAIPAGGAATLLGNAGRMALAGAAPGLLEYGSAGERALRGGIGAAAGAAVPLLGAAVKTGKSFLEPLFGAGREAIAGRTLNRVAGADAPAVAQRLTQATELVPGSAPTAAQVAQSGGIAALERSASSANPQAYTERAMEQAAARTAALRGIAGDEASLAAALAKRKTVGGAAYARATAAGVDTQMADALAPQISSLLERDEIKAAIAEAKSLAKSEGYNLTDEMGSVQGLQYVKQALDDRIADLAPNAKNKIRVWTKTSNDLKSVLDDIAPELRQADRTYARLSREPNRMQVGQALLDKAQPALADFGGLGAENGALFARALRNVDPIAQKATGLSGATAESVLSPAQRATVQSVAEDFARRSNAQNLGRGVGSNTFQNFAMSNIAEQSGAPRAVGGLLGMPGVARATAWAYRDTDQKVKDLLADALLDPKKAADLMARADQKWLSDNPGTRRLLEQAAVRGGGLLGLSAGAQATQGLLQQ